MSSAGPLRGRGLFRCVLAVTLSALPGQAHAGALGPGKSFLEEANALFRIAACAGGAPIPEGYDRAVVDAHCKRLGESRDLYRHAYLEPARRLFRELVPPGPEQAVVYPFGGGDLLSALATFPEARDLTTVSLEHSGDPRLRARLAPHMLSAALEELRNLAGGLLVFNDNVSVSLSAAQKSPLAAELAMFLIALSVHGYHPVEVRYFRLEADGALHYLEDGEIARLDAGGAKALHPDWAVPELSPAFSNVELLFEPDDPPPPGVRRPTPGRRVHRHIAADLSNAGFSGPLERHLAAKGPILAMTKAASYLLWDDGFSALRSTLLRQMTLMVSDSTGIPPSIAARAGFIQETWGEFDGSFLEADEGINAELRRLFASGPERVMPIRYGYVDEKRQNHLLVTRRPRALELLEEGGARVAGGRHWRLWTEREVVHVWIPPDYQPETAGIVVYLHGYQVNADRAFVEHRLAEQFRASGKNALFLVPEASFDDEDGVAWPALAPLLEAALSASGVRAPAGPVVAVAHSGGYRTVVEWLDEGRLAEIVLLDGVYYLQVELAQWARGARADGRPRRMVLVTSGADRTEELGRLLGPSLVRGRLGEVKGAERARWVLLEARLEHNALVTSGQVLPRALRLTSLRE